MKVAIISGGTKGIGKAVCQLLLTKGLKVYTSARSIDHNFTHTNLFQFAADLSTKEGVIQFAKYVRAKENVIDILEMLLQF